MNIASHFPAYKTRADLQKLLDEGAAEGTMLEFKDSRSLSRDPSKVTDLCINISALANSAGGQVIFGINENKKSKGPVEVDQGVEDGTITREWIGQILNSHIQPRLPQYRIEQVDMLNGKFGYVVTVPQSRAGPHQAPDHKYYKRFELQVRAMEDYEIRDVMRRAMAPELHIGLSFPHGERENLEFEPQEEFSKPVYLLGLITNRSSQPAEHAVFKVGISASLRFGKIVAPWQLFKTEETEKYGRLSWLLQRHSVPPSMPIFKEHEMPLDQMGVTILFQYRTLSQSWRWPIILEIATPGFASHEAWYIHQQGTHLRLLHPGHPLLA